MTENENMGQVIKGFPIPNDSPLGLLCGAMMRPLPSIVICDDCGWPRPYEDIAHHYIEPVHPGIGADWINIYICRECVSARHDLGRVTLWDIPYEAPGGER